MKSSTEVLRELLDERGVEWMDDSYAQLWCTVWDGQDGKQWRMTENQSGMLTELKAWKATPEQAVEATLGRGTCRNISKVMDEHGQARFACSECGAWIDSRMLWNPEYRNGESPWVSGCKLNFCPNCGRRVEVDE